MFNLRTPDSVRYDGIGHVNCKVAHFLLPSMVVEQHDTGGPSVKLLTQFTDVLMSNKMY